MASHFGTDGIRGRAGDVLTAELALRAAGGFATTLTGRGRVGRPAVVVGRDPRLSSPMLLSATEAGLMQAGCDVIDIGIVPTPVVPFALLSRKVSGGVMITASHNPVPDNGIKFFGADGFKIASAVEKAIDRAIDTEMQAVNEFGSAQKYDAQPSYLAFLGKVLRNAGNGIALKVVLDCAYGAASELAPVAFLQAGFDIDVINGKFDGSRINVKCGATDLAMLSARVKRSRADLGLAFDGDGDRVLAVDHLGRAVSGDKIIALLATRVASYKKQGAVVMTQMTNLGVEEELARQGIRMLRTEVGDIQVLNAMRKAGLSLGGEQSGHVIMGDISTSGDGILTGLRVAELVRKAKKPLAALAAVYPEFAQQLTNLQVNDRESWRTNKALARELAWIRGQYSDVRFYLRPSGTESLIRV
ncbi:MAG: phosphoglucosamine mutase, partial [bacterium]|nr:phosphoglucosamine mutase [bacterium]